MNPALVRTLRTSVLTATVIAGVAGVAVFGAGALTGGGGGPAAIADQQAALLVQQAAVVQPAPNDQAGATGVGPAVDGTWLSRQSARTAIPVRALDAYASAALTLGREQPGCHLGWTTLAAIGAVESGHGTHGGAVLGEDGRPTVPIHGPALDGDGVAAISTEDGWDRAAGPLQFITSTWQRWGTDGDGDGVADPQDLDDAAVSAGRYLCAAGGDLRTGAGWTQAIHAYNHSDEYVASVLAVATSYAR